MFSQKINITAIRESVDKVMDNSRKCIDRLYKSMDFEAVVESVLKKFGYVYNFDTKSGNFTITAAPGYYILANWKDHVYHIHIKINQSGLSVDSIDANNVFVISPYDVENCKPVFDKMIADLQRESDKYESAIKGAMGAKLLKSMIASTLRKYKLTGTKMEKCDDDQGQFWLIKKACVNVSLRTKINFDDYEARILRLVNAFDTIPDWIKELNIIAHHYHYPEKGRGIIGDFTNIKMSYRSLPAFDYSLNQDYSTSELSRKLDEKGFIYYVTVEGGYNIFLNEYMLLCRIDEKVMIKRISGESVSSKRSLSEPEFIALLDILTWGCSKEGFYSTYYRDLNYLLEHSLMKVLPNYISFSVMDNEIGFSHKGIDYKVDMKSGSGMSLIKHLVKAFRSNEKIYERLIFDDVQTIVRDGFGNYDVLKL